VVNKSTISPFFVCLIVEFFKTDNVCLFVIIQPEHSFFSSFFGSFVVIKPENPYFASHSGLEVVGKLGHTGLVLFVDELGTVCWEVPLEYGFEGLV